MTYIYRERPEWRWRSGYRSTGKAKVRKPANPNNKCQICKHTANSTFGTLMLLRTVVWMVAVARSFTGRIAATSGRIRRCSVRNISKLSPNRTRQRLTITTVAPIRLVSTGKGITALSTSPAW